MSEILRLTALATTSAIAVNYTCSTNDRVWFWAVNHSLLRILLDDTSDSRLSISDDNLLFLLYLQCFLMAARGRPLLIVSRSELEHLLSLCFTWSEIAAILNVFVKTLQGGQEWNLTRYTNIT